MNATEKKCLSILEKLAEKERQKVMQLKENKEYADENKFEKIQDKIRESNSLIDELDLAAGLYHDEKKHRKYMKKFKDGE